MKTPANKLLCALVLCLFLLSCSNEKDPVLAPEYIFDNVNLKVISSIINQKKGTIAVIYGNDLAFNTASNMRAHRDGEKFEMVTWRLKLMPKWYGTDMNGQILSVETVEVSKKADGKLLFNYHYKPTDTYRQAIQKPDSLKQTMFIVSQPAAVFP